MVCMRVVVYAWNRQRFQRDSSFSLEYPLKYYVTLNPKPWKAHFGSPASAAKSASIVEAPGSFSEGFKTNVLPAAMARGNIHRGTIAGKLNGQMPATTCTIDRFFPPNLVNFCRRGSTEINIVQACLQRRTL